MKIGTDHDHLLPCTRLLRSSRFFSLALPHFLLPSPFSSRSPLLLLAHPIHSPPHTRPPLLLPHLSIFALQRGEQSERLLRSLLAPAWLEVLRLIGRKELKKNIDIVHCISRLVETTKGGWLGRTRSSVD